MPLSPSRETSPRTMLGVGIDLVLIREVAASVERFGTRYTERLFTPDEISYCAGGSSADIVGQRFAARFAAKEATRKALRLRDEGTDWRSIEVRRAPDGWCELALHGRVLRASRAAGFTDFALSMSHEGEYATAVVTAWRDA